MVKSCPVCKWSGFRMASEYQTKKSGIQMARLRDYHSYVANCHSYVLPFENRTLKSLVFRWIRYSGVRYSNGYCIELECFVLKLQNFYFKSKQNILVQYWGSKSLSKWAFNEGVEKLHFFVGENIVSRSKRLVEERHSKEVLKRQGH